MNMVCDNTMKKKRLFNVVILIVSLLIATSFLYSISLLFYNPFLSKRMVNYYSNDSNFHSYSAVIEDYSKKEPGYLKLTSIDPLEENISTEGIDHITARIFSEQIEKTWSDLNPVTSLSLEFVGTFKCFFDGCPAAIIQITVRNEEILSTDAGKSSLIKWAKQIH